MTLTVCGVGIVDIGFAASWRWQPVAKAELTTKVSAKIVLKPMHLSMKRKFTNSVSAYDWDSSFERNYKDESSNCDEERSRKKSATGQYRNGQR
jgi:hypothetical protein